MPTARNSLKGEQQQQQPQQPDVDSVVDLDTLMSSVDQLFELASPFVITFRICQSLCRWESPKLCTLLLLLMNGMCLLPVAYQLLMTWTLLVGLGSLGYLHMKTGALVKVFPHPDSRTLDGDTLTADQQQENDRHGKLICRFKTLLLLINAGVEFTCHLLSMFFAVMKWDNASLSACVYLAAFIEVGLLYLVPLHWNLLLLVDAILLYIPAKGCVDKVYRHVLKASQATAEGKEDGANLAVTPSTDVLTLSQAVSSGSEAVHDKDSETDNSEKMEEAGSDCSECDFLDSSEVRTLAAKKPGVMGRLKEFKKKRQAAPGRCTNCDVTFTAVWKRRHVCAHCGYQFCSKCCSQKVPKKLLGATSPSAQTETVPVCQQCHIFLTGKTGGSA